MKCRAISPVVSTVILVAIAITIAVAVAFWAQGIASQFTRFEKLDILAIYPENSNQIRLYVKNSGPQDLTIDDIYINGKPMHATGILVNGSNSLTQYIASGETTSLLIDLNNQYSSGTIIELTIHTATGKTFPAGVTLP